MQLEMVDAKWSDGAFLDGLRTQGDELADETFDRLHAEHGTEAVSQIFRVMKDNTDVCGPDAPAPFVEYFEKTKDLPEGVDRDRLRRGEEIYLEHAFPVALTLLAKSLPEGYSAPNLSQILHLSGDLERHPYRRLLGVLQMVVNVSTEGGFDDDGAAIVTAQKLRLLHAGVRHIADKRLPEYRGTFGVPVNHEDMLGTIMGFSYLVIEGLQRLDLGLEDEEAEDLYYPWRIFSQLMGIHPPGEPQNDSLIPASVAEAKLFYDTYGERHFAPAADNPEGVKLAADNLRMMRDMMPRVLRFLGLGIVPRIYMNDLMDDEALARVGIAPVSGHRFLKWLLLELPHWIQGLAGIAPGHSAEAFSSFLFQGMIRREWGGTVEFLVPDSLDDLHNLA